MAAAIDRLLAEAARLRGQGDLEAAAETYRQALALREV